MASYSRCIGGLCFLGRVGVRLSAEKRKLWATEDVGDGPLGLGARSRMQPGCGCAC